MSPIFKKFDDEKPKFTEIVIQPISTLNLPNEKFQNSKATTSLQPSSQQTSAATSPSLTDAIGLRQLEMENASLLHQLDSLETTLHRKEDQFNGTVSQLNDQVVELQIRLKNMCDFCVCGQGFCLDKWKMSSECQRSVINFLCTFVRSNHFWITNSNN